MKETVYHTVIITELMHTLKRRDGNRVSRVLSGFIRQMSEDNLLIPEESINLISIVGQG